ncbi:malonyl CoA-acyl carrier protein transacylase [Verticillium dahliae VdLs.17]|uniref:[acyl-carrier-protein] S-malonyltransferase n=1 Tax=Verticillium dahliae (strain VdLs.17 / ATCC MYA-4575 / FGSC 10137) TaxID=498257 RepID=G2XEF7_VERDV|nr:malonyl CoA-acyl carrier protein transacylase [Verticillium dahliae VdLs.17]EGY18208.1 malonyl CoA-acyl carrier protein transacylase [Verticillium dahliae VdLs.17]
MTALRVPLTSRRIVNASRAASRTPTTPATAASASQHVARRYASTAKRPRTALFFPGQGVQKVGMMTPWIEAFPATAKPIVEEIDHCLGYKLSDVIRDGPGKTLTKTSNAQPAIMATSILILRILEREFGFDTPARIDVTLGHSLGEFAALVAGGYITFDDSLSLVRARARAMEDATRAAIEQHGGEYGMVAVITEPEYLDSLVAAVDRFVRPGGSQGSKAESNYDLPPFQQVSIANVNSKKSNRPQRRRGPHQDPCHSPAASSSATTPATPAVATMRRLLSGKSRVPGREGDDIVTFPGRLPCVSNVSARPFESKAELQDLLSRQCLETVRWWDSIKYLDQEEKVRRWVGIGPGRVGRNLVGKEVGMKGHDTVKGGGVWAITDPSDIEEVLRGLEETERVTDDEMNA